MSPTPPQKKTLKEGKHAEQRKGERSFSIVSNKSVSCVGGDGARFPA